MHERASLLYHKNTAFITSAAVKSGYLTMDDDVNDEINPRVMEKKSGKFESNQIQTVTKSTGCSLPFPRLTQCMAEVPVLLTPSRRHVCCKDARDTSEESATSSREFFKKDDWLVAVGL
jgi:hypothetical protein